MILKENRDRSPARLRFHVSIIVPRQGAATPGPARFVSMRMYARAFAVALSLATLGCDRRNDLSSVWALRCWVSRLHTVRSRLQNARSSSAAPVPSRTSADLGSVSMSGVVQLRDFPHPIGEIPPRRPCRASGSPRKPETFLRWIPRQAGAALALRGGEHPVFRAALFSIVLTLAAGQNAALLCEVWCQDATSAGCPHRGSTTSPSVSADDSCSRVVVEAVGFVREDARRTAAAPDAQNALALPRFRLVPSPTNLRSGFEAGRRLLLEERPLILALRI